MLLTKEDFKIGQEVAGKHVGNKARYDKGYSIGKVVKAGRKYITVSLGGYDTQFELEERLVRDYLLQKSNISGDYELFPSKQKYLDYEEKQDKISKIKASFPSYGECDLSVDQVRRIYEITVE